MAASRRGGPLEGVRVLELAGLGPAPFCGMMLGDMGAEVIRIERPGALWHEPSRDPLLRNRRSLSLNLKHPEGLATALSLVAACDVLIEGYRPGVMERLGIGPAECLQRNARLVYGRITGWGQTGPLAGAAGHDLNYVALTGALHLIGPPGGKPVPPVNLVGDFGGGAMLLLSGVLAALLESKLSGKGQVVDAAIVDGTVALLGMMFSFRANSFFRDATGENVLAGGAPFYDTYETRDGRYVSIAALEPQFYALLQEKLGIDDPELKGLGIATVDDAAARARWPALRTALARLFKARSQEEWCRLLEGTDVCFAPVLTLEEAARHPHNIERRNFVTINGVLQNAPVPRFSRTALEQPECGREPGQDTESVLADVLSLAPSEIERLRRAGALS
ncbi:MAG: CaiB/BaiF CoA-transferase family protein [Steroidobacteraceae bacterium]